MDILNTVIALLGLLATVIIGTAKITWRLPKYFFGIRTTQSTILKNDKKNDRPTVYQTQAVIYS